MGVNLPCFIVVSEFIERFLEKQLDILRLSADVLIIVDQENTAGIDWNGERNVVTGVGCAGCRRNGKPGKGSGCSGCRENKGIRLIGSGSAVFLDCTECRGILLERYFSGGCAHFSQDIGGSTLRNILKLNIQLVAFVAQIFNPVGVEDQSREEIDFERHRLSVRTDFGYPHIAGQVIPVAAGIGIGTEEGDSIIRPVTGISKMPGIGIGILDADMPELGVSVVGTSDVIVDVIDHHAPFNGMGVSRKMIKLE